MVNDVVSADTRQIKTWAVPDNICRGNCKYAVISSVTIKSNFALPEGGRSFAVSEAKLAFHWSSRRGDKSPWVLDIALLKSGQKPKSSGIQTIFCPIKCKALLEEGLYRSPWVLELRIKSYQKPRNLNYEPRLLNWNIFKQNPKLKFQLCLKKHN